MYKHFISNTINRKAMIYLIGPFFLTYAFYTDHGKYWYRSGYYIANVEYINPESGKRSEYELEIEVNKGYLSAIYFPNGGWLDESHFYTQRFDFFGEMKLQTFEGYFYSISIKERLR